jgi:Cysteine-rich CPXCG
MKRARPGRGTDVPGGTDIDARYGLEPVFEPGAAPQGAGLGAFVAINCPYCGESFDTPIDLTAGSFSYIEDCQICCQPIELDGRLSDEGALISLIVRRLD